MVIQYFRVNLLLQLLIYLLLSYVIVAHRFDPVMVMASVAGIVLYIPFTVFLYKRAQEVISGGPNGEATGALYGYLQETRRALLRFYRFKKLSDVILVPLSCTIGTYLTFALFIPGGIRGSIYLALTVFVLTLISCYVTIGTENREKFRKPLQQLKELTDEFSEMGSIY
ncbi:hypothetical protein [Compostibacter hankyongensis]